MTKADNALPHAEYDPAQLDRALAERTRYLTVAVEDLYQPHNAAAVVRACERFGVQDLHVIENRNPFRLEDDSARRDARALTIQRWQGSGDSATRACLQGLRECGYRIAATTLAGKSMPLAELPLDRPIALCFGAEELGLSEAAHDLADLRVFLPMYGFTQSFNISVTVALSLLELTDRLRRENAPWPLSPEEKDDLRQTWRQRFG